MKKYKNIALDYGEEEEDDFFDDDDDFGEDFTQTENNLPEIDDNLYETVEF